MRCVEAVEVELNRVGPELHVFHIYLLPLGLEWDPESGTQPFFVTNLSMKY